jgi:hypothetical protein
MAHPVERVTNDQVLAALRELGYRLPEGFDVSGAQNSTWRSKVVKELSATGQDFSSAVDRAIKMAKDLAAIEPGDDPIDKIYRTLRAYGMNDDQATQLYDEAARIRQATGGLYDRNKPYDANELLAAAGKILGDTPMVRTAAKTIGAQPPGMGPPAPTSAAPAGAQAIPSTVSTPAGPVGGPRMRPGPGTAPTSPAPAAPGAAGTGGGGGGPSNQPPPPSTWNDDQIRTFIKQNFGSNAYFIDIPEVWEALKGVVKSGKGINGLEPALETTSFWKSNTVAARSWYVKEKADPAQAAADIAQQTQAIQNVAQQAGITLDPVRAQQMAQSYLRYGWTQTDLQRAIGAEWHYDPATKNQAAAVTKMKADARNWLVPLSDQAIETWGQGLISGTTTQANFDQYLRDSAKSLMPQLSNLIDSHAGDPNFTVKTFADPYAQHAANLLGIQSDQVDLADPKWRRALDLVDPKTGERRIMSLAEWDSTIKTDQSYGYDKSTSGVNEAMGLASQLKQSLGF